MTNPNAEGRLQNNVDVQCWKYPPATAGENPTGEDHRSFHEETLNEPGGSWSTEEGEGKTHKHGGMLQSSQQGERCMACAESSRTPFGQCDPCLT